MGDATILLSNRWADRRRAKYNLVYIMRTHNRADDKLYRCVLQEADSKGKVGIKLNIYLMAIAGKALKSNIMGLFVLPASEQILFALSLIGRKFINSKWKPYIPDFNQAFEHFCIHTGGREVIDELQKSLDLSEEQVEASSSSLWY
ncbi:hypothetical protein ACS0TY_030144 [Phlomoides rotata]